MSRTAFVKKGDKNLRVTHFVDASSKTDKKISEKMISETKSLALSKVDVSNMYSSVKQYNNSSLSMTWRLRRCRALSAGKQR